MTCYGVKDEKSPTSDFFSKRFSSRLSTYLEKSEFSLFVICRVQEEKSGLGPDRVNSTKSERSDFLSWPH